MVAQRAQHMVVDVGGSHVTAAAVITDDDGTAELASRVERSVDPHAPSGAVLDAWAAACAEAAAAAGVDRGSCDWGLAMPGPFDYERGIGRYAGVGKFDGLSGVDVRSALAERLAVRPDRIRFVHDAGAYGIGEWRFGAPGRHLRHSRFVCVTLGTGVGSAFVDGGALVYDRPDVAPGGELYRLSFAGRPLEDSVSTRAILARYAAGSAVGAGVGGAGAAGVGVAAVGAVGVGAVGAGGAGAGSPADPASADRAAADRAAADRAAADRAAADRAAADRAAADRAAAHPTPPLRVPALTPALTVKDLATLARAGDDHARAVFHAAMESLGLALGPWLDAFGATALVVGGSISRSWDLLEPGLRAGLDRSAPERAAALELAPSRLLADAPLYGAAHLLREAAAGPCVTAPALA